MIGKVGMALVTTVDFVAVQIGIVFEAHLCRDYRPLFAQESKVGERDERSCGTSGDTAGGGGISREWIQKWQECFAAEKSVGSYRLYNGCFMIHSDKRAAGGRVT